MAHHKTSAKGATAPGQSLRTPLGRVRGLGAAGHGADHFIRQRLSAVVLVLLAPFAGYVLARAVGMDQRAAQAWIGQPVNAAVLFAFIATLFTHFRLGAQVVIEDYVAGKAARAFLLAVNHLAALVLILAAGVMLVLIAAREDAARHDPAPAAIATLG